MGEVTSIQITGDAGESASAPELVAPATKPVVTEETPATTETDPQADPKLTIPTKDERPDWLPEKFKSPEEMAKAYGELQTKLGELEETPKEGMGADFLDPFSEEFASTGELSAASYEKLQAKGLNKSFVDIYINGVKAQAALEVAKVHEVVGGRDAFEQMTTWAAANLPAEELNAFNTAVTSGDINQSVMAVKALQASYHATNGTVPKLLKATDIGQGSDVYEDRAQLMKDMQSDDYKNPGGHAFRAKVQAKLARSSIM